MVEIQGLRAVKEIVVGWFSEQSVGRENPNYADDTGAECALPAHGPLAPSVRGGVSRVPPQTPLSEQSRVDSPDHLMYRQPTLIRN